MAMISHMKEDTWINSDEYCVSKGGAVYKEKQSFYVKKERKKLYY